MTLYTELFQPFSGGVWGNAVYGVLGYLYGRHHFKKIHRHYHEIVAMHKAHHKQLMDKK